MAITTASTTNQLNTSQRYRWWGHLKGVVAFVLFVTNTVLICTTLLFLAVPKLILSQGFLRAGLSRVIVALAELWAEINSAIGRLTQSIQWDIEMSKHLNMHSSYLVVANHRSWSDIVVLEQALNRKIPFMRVFIKRQLMWVPFLNIGWWALDCPSVRRHSKEYLQAHPRKAEQDFRTTRKFCEKFKSLPTSILIFAEGTRFTAEKKQLSQSPYRNLMVPKVGGISTVLDAMGEQFTSLLDVTIHYPGGPYIFWDLFSGKIFRVVVRVVEHKIPHELLSVSEAEAKACYHKKKAWLEEIWRQKDVLLEGMQAST